jgi:hypothetical protein
MHTYIYTYVHTYIYTYVHTYIHSYLHTYIHMYLHTCKWIYGHRYIHTYIFTYIHIYLHKFVKYVHYKHICIFTDVVTCPNEPSKTQSRKIPLTRGKYTKQYLLLAQKIKINSKVAKTQQNQQGPHSQACMN